MKKVVFLHGLEGNPNGSKPTFLRKAGYEVIAPVLDTSKVRSYIQHNPRPMGIDGEYFAEALKTARQAVMEHNPDVVVGSSFGGGLLAYMVAEKMVWAPVVLLAPAATKLFGIDSLSHSDHVAVVHGRDDDVVPVLDSIGLVTGSTGPVTLTLVDDDHRLKKQGTKAMWDALELVFHGAS